VWRNVSAWGVIHTSLEEIILLGWGIIEQPLEVHAEFGDQ